MDYATLKTRIADYLKRSDLTDYIPSFITMAENEINRRLKIVQRESVTPLTLSSGNSTMDLTGLYPLGFVYRLVNSEPQEIPYLEPLQFMRKMSGTSGAPRCFTVREATVMGTQPQLQFDRTADQNYTIYIPNRYNFALSSQSDNWLSSNHEDCYLFGSLCQAEPFIKNDKRIALWRTMFEAVLTQIEDADREWRGRQHMTLVSEVAQHLGAVSAFDINEG